MRRCSQPVFVRYGQGSGVGLRRVDVSFYCGDKEDVEFRAGSSLSETTPGPHAWETVGVSTLAAHLAVCPLDWAGLPGQGPRFAALFGPWGSNLTITQ